MFEAALNDLLGDITLGFLCGIVPITYSFLLGFLALVTYAWRISRAAGAVVLIAGFAGLIALSYWPETNDANSTVRVTEEVSGPPATPTYSDEILLTRTQVIKILSASQTQNYWLMATQEASGGLVGMLGTAGAKRQATFSACQASPTCELVDSPAAAIMFARQTARAGE